MGYSRRSMRFIVSDCLARRYGLIILVLEKRHDGPLCALSKAGKCFSAKCWQYRKMAELGANMLSNRVNVGIKAIIWLSVGAALADYFYIKHRQQVRSRSELSDPAKWTGKAIDITSLKSRVEEVRRNHLVARQPAKGLSF